MFIGAEKPTYKAARSGDHVRSCYVSTPSSSPVVPRGLAGTCSHRRDNSGLYNRLSCLSTLPRRRKMVNILTKKEWAYA